MLPGMTPPTGSHLVLWAGDRITFRLNHLPPDAMGRLRSTIGRADIVRREIVQNGAGRVPAVSAAWHDVPLQPASDGSWELTLPLTEVGWFEAKAFAVDREGRQHWPHGQNVGINVQPSWTRSGNSIYCAFPRQFGPTKTHRITVDPASEVRFRELDAKGFTVIPPSGTLRDLRRELPHIFERLGCRILHLLPISPTPTTFAKFGRFGSPYAAQDLTAIDPVLVEFDQLTTGIQQFQELTHEVHCLGGRVMLDMVINHTGWGSTLWEQHPEWFHRDSDGRFLSPGAWGTIWEDLVELNPDIEALWKELAAAFLTWCQRGVDAFRCDAGYKVPLPVWRYIVARVRQEFPNTVFLLEGLGGSWDDTEALLREGGMQWAYSELFQNHGGVQVQWYLDQAYRMSQRAGPLIHYSETHDNLRLTAQVEGEPASAVAAAERTIADASRNWSLLRNRLSALTSVSGGWGFTNGVEWLATERVNVHSSRGLAWGSPENLIEELATLLRLTRDHPCFFNDATLKRVSPDGAAVFALHRSSTQGADSVLVLANNDLAQPQSIEFEPSFWKELGEPTWDLTSHPPARLADGAVQCDESRVRLVLAAGACHCLSSAPSANGLSGEAWRRLQRQSDWALQVWTEAAGTVLPPHPEDRTRKHPAANDPAAWLAFASRVAATNGTAPAADTHLTYSNVIRWTAADVRRKTPIPPGHWILIEDPFAFRAEIRGGDSEDLALHLESIEVDTGHVAAIPPKSLQGRSGILRLRLERLLTDRAVVEGELLVLRAHPENSEYIPLQVAEQGTLLLTNERGGMARLRVDLGQIQSKYDCLLGANLHPSVPVDRHVFVKRLRAWALVDGFTSPLNAGTLHQFQEGPPATWDFLVRGGNRSAAIQLTLNFVQQRNTIAIRFRRLDSIVAAPINAGLDPGFRLIVRFDLEDRSFHSQTKHNEGADNHFHSHTRSLSHGSGFRFHPTQDRFLEVRADQGKYHPGIEWSHNIDHPNERSRGQEPSGDAWSPGWFEVPLHSGESVEFLVDAETAPTIPAAVAHAFSPTESNPKDEPPAPTAAQEHRETHGSHPLDRFALRLTKAVRQYVVRRGHGKTVIAGYPWFLDWGRDTLIACRGLIAADMLEVVRDIVITFGRFEDQGTLPNAIHGEDASNRDTSDAQLWFGVVVEELAVHHDRLHFKNSPSFFAQPVAGPKTLKDVLRSIACGYLNGTPNGIQVDAASGLVWSPSHFTWMDTNHPAGTPREGYPVEIQALWIRLLRLLDRLACDPWDGRGESWGDLARRAEKSFHQFFWLEDSGWYADLLIAARGHPARVSPPSNALRSNCLIPIALGIDQHPKAMARARRTVEAVRQWLLIPGGLRSLAPLPVIPPLSIYHQGHLLNDPNHPYWPRYEGDEDTRRKPAYHNGTAWMWTFPSFCEALIQAYPNDPAALAAARSYLLSMESLLNVGCIGHLPEVADGDAPHHQRGCDAQAWSATEALRVWKLLSIPG